MACLALTLQPVRGNDLLVHTRPFFPPYRAAAASEGFKSMRKQTEEAMPDRLGDDPLAASSGQVVVGKEIKYRIVYRLVKNIYVLGITYDDDDANFSSTNIFLCNNTVNQAVSVLVSACKGVDVTPEKISKKFSEIYLALEAVMHGVSSVQLASVLESIKSESAASNFLSFCYTEMESKARGADSWHFLKLNPVQRIENMKILSHESFEMPEETLKFGDEKIIKFTPQKSSENVSEEKTQKDKIEIVDPFAASDLISSSSPLGQVSENGKDENANRKSSETSQAIAQLAELQTNEPVGGTNSIKSQFVSAKGFEGDYGGVDFENEGNFGAVSDNLLGDSDASVWGGGLSSVNELENGVMGIHQLIDSTHAMDEGRKLETMLNASLSPPPPSDLPYPLSPSSPLDAERAPAVPEIQVPQLWTSETIFAEFKGMKLGRVRLEGVLHCAFPKNPKSLVPKSDTEFEFSFHLDGASGIKRAIMKNTILSNLGNGYFHFKGSDDAEKDKNSNSNSNSIQLIKYRLYPQFTPLPIRVRFHTRRSDDSLSLMIQYVANPYLPSPLKNVTFILCLPFSPAAIKVNPSGILNSRTKELKWMIPIIEPNSPQRLRAQIPIIPDHLTKKEKEKKEKKMETDMEKEWGQEGMNEEEEEEEKKLSKERIEEEEKKKKMLSDFKVRVEFSCEENNLSGINVSALGNSNELFVNSKSNFKSHSYLCS